jgi:hypothetical protein
VGIEDIEILGLQGNTVVGFRGGGILGHDRMNS